MIFLGHFSEFSCIVSPTVCQASLVSVVEWNCSNSGCLLIFNSVGFTLHNLASTYLQQRKFEEAQSCYEVFSFDGTQKIRVWLTENFHEISPGFTVEQLILVCIFCDYFLFFWTFLKGLGQWFLSPS
jgi:hypothetical protein